VTQIVMGSVLFPLFQLVFSYEDSDDPLDKNNSAELAWRTIFIVPSVVSLLTAYAIVYHADDSPKGKT
jgi:sugar phosphate permease